MPMTPGVKDDDQLQDIASHWEVAWYPGHLRNKRQLLIQHVLQSTWLLLKLVVN